MRKTIFLGIIGAGLWACSTVSVYNVKYQRTPINDSISTNYQIDLLIKPYRESLVKEMSVVLTYAKGNFEKGTPEGTLGNLVCDLVKNFGIEWLDSSKLEKLPMLVMFNNGGLRNPISKGNVTVEDIFKLMPFDNELVMVRMSPKAYMEMHYFIKKVGGVPIGGLRMDSVSFYSGNSKINSDIWVLTSDYLAKGGDKYDFFKSPVAYYKTNFLIRDCLIKEFNKPDTIYPLLDKRIKLN